MCFLCACARLCGFMHSCPPTLLMCSLVTPLMSLCPYVPGSLISTLSDLEPLRARLHTKQTKAIFSYSLMDPVTLALSKIPSAPPLRAAFTTPLCEIINISRFWNWLNSSIITRHPGIERKTINFRKLSACRTRHLSLFWLILLVLYIFNIKSSLNFLCRNVCLWTVCRVFQVWMRAMMDRI